jgi:hypothetical protein
MRAADGKRLPSRTIPRISALVARSRPNPDRPRLDEEVEKRLEPLEQETACTFAEMEEATFEINRAAAELADEDEPSRAG